MSPPSSSAAPRVVVLVLAYNGVELTLDCLASLRGLDYPNYEVLVVDNASTDDTVAAVRAGFPEVRLIEAGANLGYAEGNNLGLRAALERGAEAVFLVNNDTVLAPDCVTGLVRAWAAHPQAGMLGPMVYTWDEGHIIFSAGGVIDWRNANADNVGAGEPDRGAYPARVVDYVNGCGLLVTRAVLERVGFLDARFFMYWEETDWCLRARAAGFESWFEPAAWMRHKAPIHHRDLGPTTLYYVTRNRLLFFARHTPPAQKPLTLARAVHGAVRGIIWHYQAGRVAHARATQWALWHALSARWGRADAQLWQTDRPSASAPSSIRPT